jgi:cobalt-zinc-cadmium efflux system outer membrane protein
LIVRSIGLVLLASLFAGAAEPPSSTRVTALIAAAQQRHPGAEAVKITRRAAAAQIAQAGTWANPELEFNLGRTRPRIDDVDVDHPYGLSLRQRVLWQGQRNARIAVAQAEAASREAGTAATQAEIAREVRVAAIAHAVAEQSLTDATAQVDLAAELAAAVAAAAAAGEVDAATAAQARVEQVAADLRRTHARQELATTRELLQTWCGDLPADLHVEDALAPLPNPATRATVHPQVATAQAAVAAAEARIAGERAAQLPVLTVGVFGGREFDQDTYGVTVGVEVPLWDRNHGGIAAAEAERAELVATRRTEELHLHRARVRLLAERDRALADIALLEATAIPAAEQASTLGLAAFRAGEARLSELLDSRRALLALRRDLLAARERLAIAQTHLTYAIPASISGNQP